MIAGDFREAMRNQNIVVFRFRGLQIESGDVCFDQIGKKQMREHGKLPGFGFFLIEDKVNDFAQILDKLARSRAVTSA